MNITNNSTDFKNSTEEGVKSLAASYMLYKIGKFLRCLSL